MRVARDHWPRVAGIALGFGQSRPSGSHPIRILLVRRTVQISVNRWRLVLGHFDYKMVARALRKFFLKDLEGMI